VIFFVRAKRRKKIQGNQLFFLKKKNDLVENNLQQKDILL
jgi:hypothetical protein